VTIRWMPQAADDLQAIFDFISRDSPHYARLVVERLVSAVDVLAEFPLAGRRIPERQQEDLRELVRPPYRIVYRVHSEAVHILTIFRSSRPIPDFSSS
jgi:addiction module RelE/StbE family toxin